MSALKLYITAKYGAEVYKTTTKLKEVKTKKQRNRKFTN